MSKNICLMNGSSGIALLLSFFLVLSCSKDDRLPFSETPEIELIGISHDTVVEYSETVIIKIKYLDGDGDIGYTSPDEYAVFVRDIRLSDFDGYYIGPIIAPGQSAAVTGVIDLEFPSLFIFGNREFETTQFEIKLIDRAGHESNLLTTETIVIAKE